jgi:hypothetical protein
MQILSDKGIRVAGMTALVAAAFLLLPYASALAGGDQGGFVRDQVGNNTGYTSYSSEPSPSTPCLSCYDGAGLAGTQNKAPYTIQSTPSCQTCARGS